MPEDVRGPFGSIPPITRHAVGEHLKQTAKVMHRFSQVRSFTATRATGRRIITFTGFIHQRIQWRPQAKQSASSMGSVIAHKLGARCPALRLPAEHAQQRQLGVPRSGRCAVHHRGGPASPGSRCPICSRRCRWMLARGRSSVAIAGRGPISTTREQRANSGARSLACSPNGRWTHDLATGQEGVRYSSGKRQAARRLQSATLHQSCLMARRLIEAGCAA